MNHDSLYGMANLRPDDTGLPFVVWISPGWGATDVHVYVSDRLIASPADIISVAICPHVHVVEGRMSANDLALLSKWVELNRDVLTGYWNRDIEYTIDAMNGLRPIPPD